MLIIIYSINSNNIMWDTHPFTPVSVSVSHYFFVFFVFFLKKYELAVPQESRVQMTKQVGKLHHLCTCFSTHVL